MTPVEALEILNRHQAWRRGKDIPMEEPKLIGQALDIVCVIAANALKMTPPGPNDKSDSR